MFENLMQLLERGVVALEQIAAKTAAPSWVEDKGCKCAPVVAGEPGPVFYVAPEQEVEAIDPVVEEVHPSVTEMAEADAAYLEREFLKKTLTEKGIKFKPSARTESLKKLLDAENVKAAVGEDRKCCFPKDRVSVVVGDTRILYCKECGLVHRKQDDFTGTDIEFVKGEVYAMVVPEPVAEVPKAAEPVVAPATKDDARDALVSMSASQGKEKALEVLKTIGKAEKLSDVDPSLFGAIVAACKGE